MGKYGNLSEEAKIKLIAEELDNFNKLVEGHKKLIIAIREL